MLPDKITTNRLEIRPVSVQWLDEIFAENKGNVGKYFVKFAMKDDAQSWINENRRQFERGEKMEMVVLEKVSEEFLGMVSLQKINIFPECGIWIRENSQGKGYGKEAVSAMLDWCKMAYGIDQKVRYLVEQGNVASINLAKSLKMEEKGQITNDEGVVFEEFLI